MFADVLNAQVFVVWSQQLFKEPVKWETKDLSSIEANV